MPNDNVHNRDIMLHYRDGGLQHILKLHRSYDPLQYPLLFPHGTNGWHINLKLQNGKKLTALVYYRYHIMVRQNVFILLRAKRLFQQFLVDAYCKIETERLHFLRREQTALRAHCYQDLRDAILDGDGDPRNVGCRIILPSTFTGGPRYMHEHQQDAMTYVRKYGHPDLFITTTTNPNWPEIKDNLLPGQDAHDRPDIVARVFRLKVQKLLEMLKSEMVFGKPQAWLYSIEWQKRGLPHCHLLLWLTSEHRITPDKIDHTICAEIPDPVVDPELHQIVMSNMVHGPCGSINPQSPCMQDGHCSKRYPKQYITETHLGSDSYPLYKRSNPDNGGQVSTITMRIGSSCINQKVDNRWIVPYNKLLLRSMNCHVNVELCMSIKSIKYVSKYVHKGCDQAMFTLQSNHGRQVDEISDYQNARYVSSNEAAWRILEFPIHERDPPVQQLAVHLENGQRVYFTEDTARDQASRDPPKTTLTEFFALCQVDNFAKTLLYVDVPRYYTWNKKSWNRRKQGTSVADFPSVKEAHIIGRVYTISPHQGECFYLQLLLHHVRGPQSFTDLRTVNGDLCSSFREACFKLGLLEDDNQYHLAMEEASVSNSAASLRSLFAVILTWCEPSNPLDIYEHHKEAMAEDFLHQHCTQLGNADLELNSNIFNLALNDLQDKVLSMGGRELSEYGLPQPQAVDNDRVYQREIDYDQGEQRAYVECNVPLLTTDQQDVYDCFCSMIDRNEGGMVFLDAPGGTGKTFLINLILAKLRSEGKIALATASSGIAATLLTGGRTLHSTFKISLDLHAMDIPICSIKKGTALCKVIQESKAVVVDKAPMTNRLAFEALDRTLRDLTGSSQLMGGTCMLLCGDFRQILPVVQGGTRGNIVDSCLKKSFLWEHTIVKHLHTNMRVHLCGDEAAGQFADQLLAIGDGKFPIDTSPDVIQLPENMGTFVSNTSELMSRVYPDLLSNFRNMVWLSERCILAPLNKTTHTINTALVAQLPDDCVEYRSLDSVPDESQAVHFPVEFLNSLEVSGLPLHLLSLKVNAPIIILRSLDPPRVTNGTRCVITKLSANTIEAKISHGKYAGHNIIIPRIPLIPALPFEFRRLQFPISLCFAMTVNKSQGQTFKAVGIDLTDESFTHGMLYVALSRVGSPDSLTLLVREDRKTRNVVYSEVFN